MIIPRPSYTEVTTTIEAPIMEHMNYLRIQEYFITGMATSWKCPRCHAVMFGHVDVCAYCRIRHNVITRRP